MDASALAFPAKSLARLLVKQADFMKKYKEAAKHGAIEAVAHEGQNLVVIRDAEILADMQRIAPDLQGVEWSE